MAECSDSSVPNNVNTQKQKAVVAPWECTEQTKSEKALEPLLIEDIKDGLFPESFIAVQEELQQRNFIGLNRNDIIVLFIYILMLEEGFIPNCDDEDTGYQSLGFNRNQVFNLSRKIPENWKRSENHYEFSFVLHPFPDYSVRLVCTTALDDVIINSTINGYPEGFYTMLVDPSQYIVISSTNINKHYQNIKQFAISFKNKVSNLAKADILRINGIASSTFDCLPLEIKLHLRKFVNFPISLL